ncbi:hypothetical protein GE061_014982 [Apolygus lucorum]|uniref:Exonuclease domain-containing protein n=1 Tax=Apolygus lucorum TaxID=248454 RepID=A0A8S9XJT3_APOLU|nr:hypothetical protein GE061_014982 [Apolygus lucorum]
MKNFSLVFIDFEATGLYRGADIVEIGAVSENGSTFNVYLDTMENFKESAAQVTGMSIDSEGRLLKNGKVLDTVSRKEGFEKFFKFLQDVHNSSGQKQLVLVSHGTKDFDMPLMKANLQRLDHDLWQRFDKLLFRFCDTLVFAKSARNRLGLSRLGLRAIANTLDVSYKGGNHGALSDAQLTKKVAAELGIHDGNISHCLFKWDRAFFRHDIEVGSPPRKRKREEPASPSLTEESVKKQTVPDATPVELNKDNTTSTCEIVGTCVNVVK